MDKTKRIFGLITAALIVIVAISLIVSCIEIYEMGGRPFNREIIAQYAKKISILGCFCLGFVLFGLLMPVGNEKVKAIRDLRAQLSRFHGSIPEAVKEQNRRKTYRCIFACVCILMSIYPILYLFDSDNFGIADVNGAILRAAIVVLIPTCICMAMNLALQLLMQASIQREIRIYLSNDIKPSKADNEEMDSQQKLRIVRSLLLAVGIAFVVIGAFNGGAADVLGKAIRICTECIGLG